MIDQDRQLLNTRQGTETLPQAVDQIRHLHVTAVNAGDAEGAADLFAPNGVFLPPGQPALEGLATIRAWFTGLFANIRVQGFAIQPAEGQTYGDALIEHGTWTGTFHPKNSTQTLPGGGTYVTVYARVADGSVRIMKDIFNGLPM
jgi:uncharacterized protein (TIGR02246 family)